MTFTFPWAALSALLFAMLLLLIWKLFQRLNAACLEDHNSSVEGYNDWCGIDLREFDHGGMVAIERDRNAREGILCGKRFNCANVNKKKCDIFHPDCQEYKDKNVRGKKK